MTTPWMVSSSLLPPQPRMSVRRFIPSIDLLLRRPALTRAIDEHGRTRVTNAVRAATEALRATAASGDADVTTREHAAAWIEARALDALGQVRPTLVRVINATGVVLHTNLGRAPLAAEALTRLSTIAGGYTNLEYDLAAGQRGHRHLHAEQLISSATGAQAALVVNNNAAAVLLVLATLAAGREVVVSRGELVEIGGGFRVPDVLAQSGATLREVGTTNRTRVNDYAAATNPRTALFLRVHPSNFRVEGFTERPTVPDLAAMARRLTVPLVEDLGSGWLGAPGEVQALHEEPAVAASLAAGADVVTFSGDKLLGGPQAGIIAGRRDLVSLMARHPLMRAFRADKLVYAALEATLTLWLTPGGRHEIPAYRMLTLSLDEIDRRARQLAARLGDVPGLLVEVIDGVSTPGGGSAPGTPLPTRLLTVSLEGVSAAAFEARLRAGHPPVVARILNDRVALDLRTVFVEEEDELRRAVVTVAAKPAT